MMEVFLQFGVEIVSHEFPFGYDWHRIEGGIEIRNQDGQPEAWYCSPYLIGIRNKQGPGRVKEAA